MTLLQALDQRILLGDGAMGTQLQQAGLPPGGCGEAWNLDAPDKIRDPDVFDQWSQVWSAMTGGPANNASKTASRHVTPEEIAAIEAAHPRPAIAEIVARARRTRVTPCG